MIPSLECLPGADLVSKGLKDLEQGDMTAHAYMLLCAQGRLRELGLHVPQYNTSGGAELRMYAALQKSHPRDAYRRYNSMRREFCSFVHALEQRL